MRTTTLLPLFLIAGSSIHAQQATGSSTPELFDAPTSLVAESVGFASVATQRRLVSVRPELLDRTPRFALELFGGERILVQHRRTEAALGGGFVWSGAIQGVEDGDVLLSVTGDAIVGSVRKGEELYRISPAGPGIQWLSHEDQTAFASCATETPGNAGGPGSLNEPVSGSGSATVESAAPTIDILVVYSTEAKNAVGGTNAMTSLINLAIVETNDAYFSCQVSQRLALVHTEEMLGYVEPSSFGTILNHLTSKSDGRLDEVHDLRDAYGADAVVMICENGQYCGIAHLMTNVSPGFQSNAFSVVNFGCTTGYYSFGHELGHNFGSHHDPANAGNAAYNYSYGYRTPNSQFRTIMAYAPGTRVKRFSGPFASWQGNTMGNASQDNARSMNNTASTVAAWRATVQQASLLESTTMVAGSNATLTVSGATPNSQLLLGFSLTGSGPTPSPYGMALLSAPIRLFATLNTLEGTTAAYTTSIPPNATGLTAWFQALDLGSGLLGNGIQITVE